MNRVCSGIPGKPCGRIIPANRRRCEACTTAHSRARGSATARGYGSRWQRISRRQRRRMPFCEIRLPGCTFLATEADHVVPLFLGGTSDRVQSACTNCNSKKRDIDREEARRNNAQKEPTE